MLRVYGIAVLSLFRQLAKYGAVFIDTHSGRWYVACEVKVGGTAYKKYVKVNGEKLFWALTDLIPLAQNAYKELLKEARAPKQQTFEYGTSTGYKKYA